VRVTDISVLREHVSGNTAARDGDRLATLEARVGTPEMRAPVCETRVAMEPPVEQPAAETKQPSTA
jgi:hypothetical protein